MVRIDDDGEAAACALGTGTVCEARASIKAYRSAGVDSDQVYTRPGIDLGPEWGPFVPMTRNRQGQVNFQSCGNAPARTCALLDDGRASAQPAEGKPGPNRAPAPIILPNSIHFGLNLVGYGPQHREWRPACPLGAASRSKAQGLRACGKGGGLVSCPSPNGREIAACCCSSCRPWAIWDRRSRGRPLCIPLGVPVAAFGPPTLMGLVEWIDAVSSNQWSAAQRPRRVVEPR